MKPDNRHKITPSLRSRVAPFLAMDVLAEATQLERGGASIIHMEAGEPGAPAPRAARDAAMAALALGRIGYTEALGRPSLRARIARFYGETYKVDVAPSRIAVTTGSSAGFLLSFLALFDPGARVAIASPGYPAYRNIMEALGIVCVTLETQASTRYAVTAQMIEAAHAAQKLDGVLLMSPANPSGTMMGRAALRDVCETCDRLGIAFISDEIYHGLTYEAPAETALAFSNSVIVVNSMSKYFCMTGWRIGWLVLPEDLIRPVECLAQNMFISAPHIAQVTAEAAMDCREELEGNKAAYARSRAALLAGLPKAGFDQIAAADGAFYLWCDVSALTNDSAAFSAAMLEGAGIAATTGLDFDRGRGGRFLRFSYCGREADMAAAPERLARWLGR